MNFNNKFTFDWGSNDGTEPSTQLKSNGFTGGYKPPAGVFNWFWRKVIKAITELQSGVTTVEESIPTKTSDLTNDSGYVTGSELPEGVQVVDNLTSTLTSSALSANQGKVLNDTKVTKVTGKGLSTNDYTTDEKNKLAGIAAGAQVNTVTGVKGGAESSFRTGNITISKQNLGLGSVENTSDANKPISTATQNALDKKAGKIVAGETQRPTSNTTATCGNGAEIFNDYQERTSTNFAYVESAKKTLPSRGNVASGDYSHAEGYATTASGKYSHAEGYKTTASEREAHAEGCYSTASGQESHAEGYNTTASGSWSHAEGANTTASGLESHAEGLATTASGDKSHAGGNGAEATADAAFAHGYQCKAQGAVSVAWGEQTTANGYQFVCGQHNTVQAGAAVGTQSASDTIFMIGNGTSTTNRSCAFRTTADGKSRGLQAFSSSGADFAEYFEWADGNENGEDRRGRFVTLEGEKIRFATADDDYILGAVSGAGAFIGNIASENWQGRYLRDVYGEIIMQDVVIPATTDETTGEVTPEHTVKQFAINPDYDPTQEYVSREFRKEWSPVGMLGQVVVVDDGTCTVNGYCKPSSNGVATAASSGFRVLKRVDNTHVKVLVK